MKVNEVIVEALFGKEKKIISDITRAAYNDFLEKLSKNNVNLNNKQYIELNKPSLLQALKQYVFSFMVSGESGRTSQRVALQLETVPLPTEFTSKSIREYITRCAEARAHAKTELKHELPGITKHEVKKPDGSYCEIDGPEADISKCIDNPNIQYRFMHPEYPGVEVIIRQTGYYYKQLPAEFRGLVKRDKATGLYPVLRKDNIRKLNDYYNTAADAGRVAEEPISAL